MDVRAVVDKDEEESTVVEICRTCINECKDYKSLYKPGLMFDELTTLSALLKFCTSLDCQDTEDNEYLPKYICHACIQELARSYLFKKKVLETQRVLQSQYNLDQEQTGEEDRSVSSLEFTEEVRFCGAMQPSGFGNGELVVPLSSSPLSPKKLIQYVDASDLQELAEVAQMKREWDEQYFDGQEHYVTLTELEVSEEQQAVVASDTCCPESPQIVQNLKIVSANHQTLVPEAIYIAAAQEEEIPVAEDSEVIEYMVQEESVEVAESIYQRVAGHDLHSRTNSPEMLLENGEALVLGEEQVVGEVIQELEEEMMDEEEEEEEGLEVDGRTEMLELEEDDGDEYEVQINHCDLEEDDYEVYMAEEDELIDTLDSQDATQYENEPTTEHSKAKESAALVVGEEEESSGEGAIPISRHMTRSRTRANHCETTANATLDKKDRTPNPDFKCKTCGKQLSTPGSYRYHMQLHSDLTPYLCTYCGASFKTRNAYEGHISIHDPNNPNTCHTCGRSYRQHSSLKIHMLSHSGEKPFSCDICGKKLTQKSGYKKHMLTHTGEKPHVCDLCGKEFRFSSNMLAHRRCHTGTKPYSCPHCDKRFVTSEQAKRHSQIHSLPKNYNCEDCGKFFKRKRTLVAHKCDKFKKKSLNCKDEPKKVRQAAAEEEMHSLVTDVEEQVLQTLEQQLEDDHQAEMMLEEKEVIASDVANVLLKGGEATSSNRTIRVSASKLHKSNVVEIY